MAKRLGKQTYALEKPIHIISTATIVGEKEKNGPLKAYFENFTEDDMMGEKTFEKAERKMMESCIDLVLEKAHITEHDIDLLIGGDLLNQLVTLITLLNSVDTSASLLENSALVSFSS